MRTTTGEKRWDRVLLALTASLLFFVLIITLALEVQVQSRNRDIRKVGKVVAIARDASVRAERASVAAKKAVNDAIAAGNASSATLGPKVLHALDTIEAIHQEVELLLDRNGANP